LQVNRSTPNITVIVSVYKAEEFIVECLSDLANQTIKDRLEIVIVDAASPEKEWKIIREFQDILPNIMYIRTPSRIGIYAAWNVAIKNSSADYITTFSTNDRLCSSAYEQLSDALDFNPEIMLVYGDTYLTATPHQTFECHDRIGEYRWPHYSYEYLVATNCVGPHPMWRRTVHNSIGYFDEQYVALADQELWLRVGEKFGMLHIPLVTGLYWLSDQGISHQQQIADAEFREIRGRYARRYLNSLAQNKGALKS